MLVGDEHDRYLGIELGVNIQRRTEKARESVLYANAVAAREAYRSRMNALRCKLQKPKR